MITRIRALLLGWLVIGLLGCDGQGPTVPTDDCTISVGSLAVGEVLEGETRGPEAVTCVTDPAGGTYVAVPFVAAKPNSVAPFDVVIRAEGMVPLGETTASASSSHSPSHGSQLQEVKFHRDLRRRGRELRRSAPPGQRISPGVFRQPVALPEVGDALALNVTGRCEEHDVHQGRVVAVTDHSVVLVDESNPLPDRWRDEELETLGRVFDTLVYPVVTEAFGSPVDFDGNGRIRLFFSRGVNELSPPGAGVVAGFFWSGDLFPSSQCPGTNGGEILYLAVPDPFGEVGNPLEGETIRSVALSIIGHELQHLINAGGRLVRGASDFEETWLNEGLSVLAEELLFYRASGLGPRQNLAAGTVLDGGPVQGLFERFGMGNVGRYNLFLQVPRGTSPMGRDALATRGATWSFLRYALDRDPGEDEVLLRSLAGASATGLDNLEAELGTDPLAWMGDWSASVFLDDDGGRIGPHMQPSWNFRSLVPSLRSDQEFPLEVLALSERGLLLTMGPGNTGYVIFESKAGRPLQVRFTPVEPLSAGVLRVSLIRVR